MADKLHTGRSRNDQVVTDFKLWIKSATQKIYLQILDLQKIILKKAELNINTILPGLTHLQPAQIVSFSHHLMAYYEMLKRDKLRFLESYKNINECPLGAAALAGTTFPIDRFLTAKLLGFKNQLQIQWIVCLIEIMLLNFYLILLFVVHIYLG